MGWSWIDDLAPAFRERLGEGAWSRIEPARGGGWLLLEETPGGGEGLHWWQWDGGPTPFAALSILEDDRLDNARQVIGEALTEGETVRVLAHKVGRRAVLEVSDAHGSEIWKVYRKDRAVLSRWRVLADAGGERWRTPAVRRFDAERKLLVVERVAGHTLHAHWRRATPSSDDARTQGTRLGELVTWIQSTPCPEEIPAHGVAEEVRVLEERLPVYEELLDRPDDRVRDLVGAVCRRLVEVPGVEPRLCHRDLHDKQLVIEGQRWVLIDLDLAAASPPPLDPANMIGHARLRAFQGMGLPWQELAMAMAETCRRAGIRDLGLWTAATLTRLILIYARRARREDLLDGLTASAEAALEGRGEWREIL